MGGKINAEHPLAPFRYCPRCGNDGFAERNPKAKSCPKCGLIYYANPSAATACFITDSAGRLLAVRRAKDPAKGTLDLPGGFMDMDETAEGGIIREIREETGIEVDAVSYLFSLPNIYPYGGMRVHTADLFFAAQVSDFSLAIASDDAAELVILAPDDITPEDFGLESIHQAVGRWLARKKNQNR